MKKLLACAVLVFLFAPVANAQHKDWKSWYGEVSYAWVFPEISAQAPDGSSIDPLDDGWNLTGGAIYKPKDWPVGITMELGYNSLDVTGELLRQADVSGGDVTIWSLTGGFLWTTNSKGVVNFYLEGGVGVYRLAVDLTEPGVGFRPPWCSWYWCFPGGWVPVDVVVASDSTTELGYNAGVGLSFRVPSDSEIFVEAKYHWVDTDVEATKYVPFAVGYRW